ncbi:MAG: transcription termination factor NusA [Sphaerochaetaceae bacterium]
MSGLRDAINDIADEKSMTVDQVKETIEESLLAAYKKKYGVDDNAVVTFSDDLDEVTLSSRKRVIDEAEDDLDLVHEISLVKAKELDPDAEAEDEMLIPVDLSAFDRGSVQSGKQKAQQTLRDIQKDEIYSELKKKEGQIIIGVLQSERDGDFFIDLGKTQGLMPRRNQSHRDSYQKGDKVKCLLESVMPDERNPRMLRIILSRTSDKFVERLFEQYIPELQGTEPSIGIAKIVREAGYRTKVAVYSKRGDVDAVGTCVGLGGQRIRNIITELNGELIDVLRWDPNPSVYIQNALSPAKVSTVYIIDDRKKSAVAIVDDDQLSLAIGKMGLNVRLVNRLCDWMVDVKTKDQFAEMDISKQVHMAADQLFENPAENPPDFSEPEEHPQISEETVQEEPEDEDEELQLDELPISQDIIKKLNFYDIYSVEEYIELTPEDIDNMPKFTNEDKEEVDKVLSENVDFVESEENGEEQEVYKCPNCGAVITKDMTECPQCHVGLSFE